MKINWFVEMCPIVLLSLLIGCTSVSARELPDSRKNARADNVCSSDLDKNGYIDVAILLKTANDVSLVVLLKNGSSYTSYVLETSSDSFLQLECRSASKLVETASKEKPREVSINGAYLALIQPESSVTAYYWKDGGFRDLWLAD